MKEISNDPFFTILAPNAVNVNNNDSCAFSPEVEAVITATGLLPKSSEETVQSRAFLRTPGTPKAYSGVQIRTVSALRIWRRQSLTGAEES